ncbi:MAG: M14 family metallopeptidase [Burkholderiaceae bacterium]
MEFHECYALDYRSARAKFRAVATAANAELSTYSHPDAVAPDGSPLHVDVAYCGSRTASRRLLVVSGTHGLEGFCGSAAQIAWMGCGDMAGLGTDVAVVMVHAINPWGFAHLSRTTENNVDLNRNFIDHGGEHPKNAGYAQLHPALLGDDWSTGAIAAAQKAMDDYAAERGADQLYDALARGQYSHADGLNFGGTQREWSNRILERIVREHLAGAAKVGLIDWHTGIGEYGQPFFLCFNEEGGSLHARAASWWGSDRIDGQRPHGKARPNYRGLLFYGVQEFLGEVPVCGAVVEFGTRGWHMRRLLRLDLWLKFKADPSSERYAMLRADLLDSFCPVDQIWRDSTIAHALHITRQAVSGLAAWSDES